MQTGSFKRGAKEWNIFFFPGSRSRRKIKSDTVAAPQMMGLFAKTALTIRHSASMWRIKHCAYLLRLRNGNGFRHHNSSPLHSLLLVQIMIPETQGFFNRKKKIHIPAKKKICWKVSKITLRWSKKKFKGFLVQFFFIILYTLTPLKSNPNGTFKKKTTFF